MEKPKHTPATAMAGASPMGGHSMALDHSHCQMEATHGQLPPPVATGWLVALTHGPCHTCPWAVGTFS